MLKAGSLLYAISICLILALISASLILHSSYIHSEIDNYHLIEKVNMDASSGLKYMLSNATFSLNKKETIDLYDDGLSKVEIELRNWGLFRVAISEAKNRSFRASIVALLGAKLKDKEMTALYIADNNKPLYLSGNTVIKGTCFLPKAGVKRAYIEGQSFVGDKLIDGIGKVSNGFIPAPDKIFLDELNFSLSSNTLDNDSVIQWEQIQDIDTIVNSFSSKTFILKSNNTITINSKSISGNIKVVSKRGIKIQQGASLSEILLIAPMIEIEDNFRGSIQCFASDSIRVGKHCSLLYPSNLVLIGFTPKLFRSLISIQEYDTISGSIIAYDNNSIINIQRDGVINGELYAYGFADIKGKIFGSAYINKIILSTPSSVYENHLLNTIIDHSKLSSNFVGCLWSDINNKELVKYLN